MRDWKHAKRDDMIAADVMKPLPFQKALCVAVPDTSLVAVSGDGEVKRCRQDGNERDDCGLVKESAPDGVSDALDRPAASQLSVM